MAIVITILAARLVWGRKGVALTAGLWALWTLTMVFMPWLRVVQAVTIAGTSIFALFMGRQK